MYYGYAKLLCLESKLEVGKETLLCNSVLDMNLLELCKIEAWTSILLVLGRIYFRKNSEKIHIKMD